MVNDNEHSESAWLKNMEDFVNTVFAVRETHERGNLEAKRDLLLRIGENCILKDKNLDITLKKPFDILVQPAYANNWLGIVNDVRTTFEEQEEYIYIPDLRQMALS